jgi:dihydrofolate reductase
MIRKLVAAAKVRLSGSRLVNNSKHSIHDFRQEHLSNMSAVKTPIALIIAVAQNGVIGRNNRLPWRIPAELKYFKASTMGKPLVMGRKTFESLGKALPGRTNIVVTRDLQFRADDTIVVHDIDSALRCADEVAQRDGGSEIMVIGGADIYRQTLPVAHTLYYTDVKIDADGDAYFRDIDWTQWQCMQQQDFAASDATTPAYSLKIYNRK